ncbi:MAG: calcium-binding protein [Pseudomonadota bacterium]
MLALLGIGLVGVLINDDDETTTSTETADSASGSDAAETFDTGGGDDTIFAGGGNDLIDAGADDDRVFGQDGFDVIVGGTGDDFIRGGAEADVLFADAGEDTLQGDVGNDLLIGADIFDSEAIFDEIDQTGFVPTSLTGFIDLAGETGEADTINGGVGDDDIIAGSNDVVTTGSGADIVDIGDWVTPGEPVTITDFNPARDVIVYNYEGPTAPNVFFAETDSGELTIEIALSNQENGVLATLPGVDFFDVGPGDLFIVQLT